MTHLLDEKVVHSDGRMVWFEVPPEKMEPKFIGGDVSFSCRYCCTQLEALLDSEDSPAYGQAMCGTCRRVYKVEVTIVEEWISV